MSRARFEDMLDDWAAVRLSPADQRAFEELLSSNAEWAKEARDHREIVAVLKKDHAKIKAPTGLMSGALAKARALDKAGAPIEPATVSSPSPKSASQPAPATVVDIQSEREKKNPWMGYALVASVAAVLVLSISLVYEGQNDFAKNGGSQQIAFATDAVEKTPEPQIVNASPVGFNASTILASPTPVTVTRQQRLAAVQAKEDFLDKLESEVPEFTGFEEADQIASAEGQPAAMTRQERLQKILEEKQEMEAEKSAAEAFADDSDLDLELMNETARQDLADEFQIPAGLPLEETMVALSDSSEPARDNANSEPAINSGSSAAAMSQDQTMPAAVMSGRDNRVVDVPAEDWVIASAEPKESRAGLRENSSSDTDNIQFVAPTGSKETEGSIDQELIAYLSAQTREAGGFQQAALPGNARLNREHNIEIVGQPKGSSEESHSGFVAEFESDDDFRRFLMRLDAIPVSVSRQTIASGTSEYRKRVSTPQLPGVRALRQQAIDRGEKPSFGRTTVSAQDFPVDEFVARLSRDTENGRIRIEILPSEATDEATTSLSEIMIQNSAGIRRY